GILPLGGILSPHSVPVGRGGGGAADAPVIPPEVRAGGRPLFDPRFLPRPHLAGSLTEDRYALECWFFAPSPGDELHPVPRVTPTADMEESPATTFTELTGTVARRGRALRRRLRVVVQGLRTDEQGVLWDAVRASHPGFIEAVLADARVTAAYRGERYSFDSRLDAWVQALRLAIVHDSFLGQICYRAKAACQARRIPLLSRVFHRLAMMTGQICIGDPVVMRPGVYIPHGQVVVDGIVEVGEGVVLFPFITIGRLAGDMVGP